MKLLAVFGLILLSGCTTQMASRTSEKSSEQIALFEEVRVALNDVRQALNTQKMDLALLEEKFSKLEKRPDTTSQVEARLASLERMQDRAISDLQSLSRHAKDTTGAMEELNRELASLEKKLNMESERLAEVANLRTTISSLTKAMSAPATQQAKTHRVKPGDSLEKIAREYQTSIEEIKHANGLKQNKILIGQELKIPS